MSADATATEASFDPARMFEQAVFLFRQERLQDSELLARRLLQSLPGNFDALHLLGLIKLKSGAPVVALQHFELALRANPHSPEALVNCAMTLAALHRAEAAIGLLDRAQALCPADWKILNSRGSIMMQMDCAAEALSCFDAALAIEPRHPGLALNRGNALVRLGRAAEALAQFDAIVVAQPNLAEGNFNRGNALASLGRLPEAIEAYDRAIVLRADYVKARLSRSVALLGLNRHREALADLDSVLAIDNANADAHNNAALALLTLGDFRRGFIEYDWRWHRTGMPPPRSFGKPPWLGEEALAGKTILLYAEQGLGDTIQFVRYVPIVAGLGAKVVIEAPRELATLLARVEGVAEVIVRGEPLPSFDAHCALGSLPRALRTEPSTIPRAVPYIHVNEDRVAKWRERLREIVSPRIAITWSGSALHPNDANRSIPLSAMDPILSLEDLNVISLQRELRDDDARLLQQLPRAIHIGNELSDFDDSAAVMSLVDIVVSVDTAVAHLAGALARPTRILIPFSPDWRWMLGRDDSTWYPTVRLFRQSAPGEWAFAIRKLADELKRTSGTR